MQLAANGTFVPVDVAVMGETKVKGEINQKGQLAGQKLNWSENHTATRSKQRRWSFFAQKNEPDKDVEFSPLGHTLEPLSRRQRSRSFSGSPNDTYSDLSTHREPTEFHDDEVDTICKIGEGGTCEVFRVVCHGQEMAAKMVKTSIVGNKHASASEDLLREVSILSRMAKHPHVVKMLGVVRTPRLMVLMEFVMGESLADFLWEKELACGSGKWQPSKTQVMAWGLGMMRGLSFLHSQQPIVMHRDMKPGNLMLCEDKWTIKIIDFGLSRPLESMQVQELNSDRPPLFSRQLTMGTGTFRYMAPEVFAGDDYSEKSDIYSAALILWELSSGKKPFLGDESKLFLEDTRSSLRPPLAQCSLPTLRPLIEQAWHTDPAARPSAQALAVALARKGARVPCSSSSSSAMTRSRDNRCCVQ